MRIEHDSAAALSFTMAIDSLQKLGMSDLMRWEHIPGPIGGHFLQVSNVVGTQGGSRTFVTAGHVSLCALLH